MVSPKFKSKAKEWIRRYLPAEIFDTIISVGGGVVAYNLTDSRITAAFVGSIGAAVGYYGYFIVHDSLVHYRKHAQHTGFKRLGLTAGKTARDMFVEFGPAEALDSLLYRPFFMYLFPKLLPNFALGLFTAKIVSDLIFYCFAIVGYEFRKKRWS